MSDPPSDVRSYRNTRDLSSADVRISLRHAPRAWRLRFSNTGIRKVNSGYRHTALACRRLYVQTVPISIAAYSGKQVEAMFAISLTNAKR
jgi:hypothetical protein